MSVNSQQLAVNYEILFTSINQCFKLNKVTKVTAFLLFYLCYFFLKT